MCVCARTCVLGLPFLESHDILSVCVTMVNTNPYSKTSLIQHSMEPKESIRLGGCRISEGLLAYFNIVTVPHEMVGLERMSDYIGFTVKAPT